MNNDDKIKYAVWPCGSYCEFDETDEHMRVLGKSDDFMELYAYDEDHLIIVAKSFDIEI